ncbi:MgtC/SapB family protein [Aliterella atlantica]|uniref:MgtC/SapB transporter n=1 Tax=Aliterella atlantica CENA595 TaxID=1618023 RepID=A0A0D8ZSY1_9CYAN|nr:MgtC/SapB family protein [Aliterella atlantica]KJH71472.1 MgtC/SapB transporter [Aliterella atlantica CENA595]
MSWIDFAIRLLLAFILGAAIGIERQWRQTKSVLKTNVLVSIGAAMFVMLSAMFTGDASPTRVAAQVVSGVGFLGGGVILREGSSVRGLNTAATLWCAAAVGSLIGAGFLFQAYVGALAVIGANLLLSPLVQFVQNLNGETIAETKLETRYRCRVVCDREDEADVRALLSQAVHDGVLVLDAFYSKNIDGKDINNPTLVEIKANILTQGRNDSLLDELVNLLKLKVNVTKISWEFISQESE